MGKNNFSTNPVPISDSPSDGAVDNFTAEAEEAPFTLEPLPPELVQSLVKEAIASEPDSLTVPASSIALKLAKRFNCELIGEDEYSVTLRKGLVKTAINITEGYSVAEEGLIQYFG